MEQEELQRSIFDLFASQQETLQEAVKKNSEENRKRTSFLRFNQDGTFSVRVLPLAPIFKADGTPDMTGRKGYEYPLRSNILKIDNYAKLDKNGKPTTQYVSICNAKQVFKDLNEDLVDAYVRVACDKYASDEALIKKLTSGSFEGGLKWNSHRCMYVYEIDKRGNGIQLLQLSFAQYKELENAKLSVWNKLIKKRPTCGCPISSFNEAYPVEIERTTENGKVKYSFRVDTVSDVDTLSEDELQTLLDTPRIPETIYRYTRYHLEATVAYLKQLDSKYGINVMGDAQIKEVIDTIKMLIPSDDNSHFTMGGSGEKEAKVSPMEALDQFWKRFDDITANGFDDKSDEGSELRSDIKEFIDENNLDVEIKRGKSNQDILMDIEKALKGSTPASKTVEEEEDDEPAVPGRNVRNDDTNEPAVRRAPIRERR